MERPRVGSSGHGSVNRNNQLIPSKMLSAPGPQTQVLVDSNDFLHLYGCQAIPGTRWSKSWYSSPGTVVASREGRAGAGGPCDHLQAPLEPPKQTALSKILKYGSSGGAAEQGPEGPRGGDAGCLADQGRGFGWPWRGGRAMRRGRRERVLLTEGGRHGRAR